MASITSGPLGGGVASARLGTPGVPALVIRAIRLFWMTTFIGPAGGAPVPSITMTLRIVSVGNGPGAFPGAAIGRGHELVLLGVEQRGCQANERGSEERGEASDHADDDTGVRRLEHRFESTRGILDAAKAPDDAWKRHFPNNPRLEPARCTTRGRGCGGRRGLLPSRQSTSPTSDC